MLEKLNSRTFGEHLRTAFQLHVPGGTPLELELAEVVEKERSPRVEQFSLIFRGPLIHYIPQGTYAVEHEKLGKFDLFFVPVGKEDSGFRYEVAFNRLRPHAR